MSTEEFDYDEELYTDTSMFDADEIVRSVEEVARNKAEENNLSARRRFEQMMEERKLAEELGEAYDEDWGEDDWDEDWA